MARPTSGAKIASQYLYNGRGPFDSKALVDTKAALLDPATWSFTGENGKINVFAYNAMVVSVWKDSEPSNNGVYYFHSPNITSALAGSDKLLEELANENNWHKIATVSEISKPEGGIDEEALNAAIQAALVDINTKLDDIDTSITTIESEISDNAAALEAQAEEIDEIQTDLGAAQTEITETQTKVDEIDAALQGIQNKNYDSQIGALQESHDSLADAVAPLSERITKNTSAIAALRTDLDGLEAQFSELDSSALKTSHIANSTEFTLIDNKLVIGAIDISKVSHDPKALRLILNGGNASIIESEN